MKMKCEKINLKLKNIKKLLNNNNSNSHQLIIQRKRLITRRRKFENEFPSAYLFRHLDLNRFLIEIKFNCYK